MGPDGDQRDRRFLLTIVNRCGPLWTTAVPLDHCEPLWTIVDQSGPATVMAEVVDEGDHCGPEWTSDCDG